MRLRYRPVQAAVLVALAALLTACAVFAPLYDRAMRQSLTDVEIQHEDPAVTGLQLSGTMSDPGGSTFASHDQSTTPRPEGVLSALPPRMRALYQQPVLGYFARATTSPGDPHDPTGPMVWRQGQCDHVEVVQGACPGAAREVMVSEADAGADGLGLSVGSRIHIDGVPRDTLSGPRATGAVLRVVGVYRQRAGDYWAGLDLTGRSGELDQSQTPPAVQHDVWLTPRETFETGDVPTLPEGSAEVLMPLDPEVGVDDVLYLGTEIERLSEQLRFRDDGLSVRVYSGLPDIATDVRQQTEQSRVTVPLLMAQLGVLSLVVLWLVLLAVVEQRRPEVALARLRGRGRRGARALLLGELLPVTLAGVVPGVLLAVLASWVARTVALPGQAPFELGLRVAEAVGLAVVVLAVVTLVAVLRVSREPVQTLLRRIPPRRVGWAPGAADSVVVAVAGAVFALFATGSLEGPAALGAPALIAIVVGLVLAHLTSPTAALLGRWLLHRGRVRAGVGILDAARSPATRRVVAVVTLASALAVFSADALAVGARNRSAAAEQEAGAPVVVQTRGNDLRAVEAALHDVDPEGTSATPVVGVLAPGSRVGGTLAVRPEGFRRIALTEPGDRSDRLWRALAVPDADPIPVRGAQLALHLRRSTLVSHRVDGERNPVTVGLDLVDETGQTLHTSFGELAGTRSRADLGRPVSCRDGCYVTAVWFGTLPGARIDGRVTIDRVSGDEGRRAVALGPPDRWNAQDEPHEAKVRPQEAPGDALTVVVHSNGPQVVSLPQRWLPSSLPALVSGNGSGAGQQAGQGETFTVTGLDSQDQPAVRVGSLDRVPGARPGTTVVNLDAAVRGRSVIATASLQVWLGGDDPALVDRVRAALDERGVTVTGVTTLHDVRRVFDDSTAAWSLGLSLVVGIAALLVALLVLVVTAVSGWRVRARDLAALRMSGMPRRALGTIALAAQVPAVLVGVVAGTLSGLYGAHLALPLVPLFAHAPAVSTLDLGTAWGAVVLAVVGAAVVLCAGAVLAGRAVAGRAHVRRLRETL